MSRKRKMDPARKAMNDALSHKIGERFKKFRRQISRTQKQLAAELKVFQSTVANFENGKTFPHASYLYHFSKNYGLNIHWLLTGDSYMFVLDYTKTRRSPM